MKPLKHVIAHSIYYAGTPLPDADSGPRKLLVDRPLEMLLVLIDPDSTSDVARRPGRTARSSAACSACSRPDRNGRRR